MIILIPTITALTNVTHYSKHLRGCHFFPFLNKDLSNKEHSQKYFESVKNRKMHAYLYIFGTQTYYRVPEFW